ncbi:MAG: IclR family transcriptional regulator [Burkholderiaceae bacterium]
MSSSLTRMLAVLDAFSAQHPVLTADDIMARLGYSRGTAYRYLRELVTVGLLARVAGGAYTLGPRIIELDFAIRQCDPVLSAGIPIMQALRRKLDCDVLLTSFYEDRVVVTHHERGDDLITVSFGRGRVMPMFRGAPSKAIVAWLPPARQKRLYSEHAAEALTAGLGATWADFRAALSSIRKDGYCVSFAELDPGNVGIAAPLATEPPHTPGSLGVVFSRSRYDILDKSLVIDIVRNAAAQIDTLAAQKQQEAAGQMPWPTRERFLG